MPPTHDTLVVHHHELGLKGKNREFFESALIRNLKRALTGTGVTKTRRMFGRIMIDLAPDARAEVAAERAARIYGVAYVGLGRRVRPDMDEIGRVALEYMQAEPFESFRVRSRRTYSSFESSSSRSTKWSAN